MSKCFWEQCLTERKHVRMMSCRAPCLWSGGDTLVSVRRKTQGTFSLKKTRSTCLPTHTTTASNTANLGTLPCVVPMVQFSDVLLTPGFHCCCISKSVVHLQRGKIPSRSGRSVEDWLAAICCSLGLSSKAGLSFHIGSDLSKHSVHARSLRWCKRRKGACNRLRHLMCQS